MTEPIFFVILFGGFAFILNLIAIVTATYRMGRAVEKFEQVGTQQAGEISQLKNAVTGIAELMTKSALQTERMDNLSARMTQSEKLVDDLRRGEGMILPLEAALHHIHPRRKREDESGT